jgi:spoIIIJ-associated protein
MPQSISIEISAPDIESAVEKGVAELGVPRDAVMVEVLEEPGRRLLGLGVRQAKVRLTVIRAPSTPPRAETPAPAPVEPVPAPQPVRPAPAAPRSAPPVETAVRPERLEVEAEEELPTESALPTDAELAEETRVGTEVLQALLKQMEFEAEIVSRPAQTDGNEPKHWTLEIHGKDLGALIGRRGETLAALQYITRLMTSHQLGRRAHLVVDVEGYKSRRESMLQRLAKRMAEQAVQRGRTVSMEPMPPHERRIIHLTLRDHPDVTTESIGEGEHRKVTVVPRRPK